MFLELQYRRVLWLTEPFKALCQLYILYDCYKMSVCRSTVLSVKYEPSAYSIMWMAVSLADAGVRYQAGSFDMCVGQGDTEARF